MISGKMMVGVFHDYLTMGWGGYLNGVIEEAKV